MSTVLTVPGDAEEAWMPYNIPCKFLFTTDLKAFLVALCF